MLRECASSGSDTCANTGTCTIAIAIASASAVAIAIAIAIASTSTSTSTSTSGIVLRHVVVQPDLCQGRHPGDAWQSEL